MLKNIKRKNIKWSALGLSIALSCNYLLVPLLALISTLFIQTSVFAADCIPNQLYGSEYVSGVSRLRIVNIADGSSTLVTGGTLNFGGNATAAANGTAAIARDAATGYIYYIEFSSTNPAVAYFDPTTGTNVLVGTTGAAIPGGGFFFNKLAQQAGTGDIYGMAGGIDNLYKIDKNTGAATLVGALGAPFPSLDAANAKGGDIAFDPNNANRLIVSVGPNYTSANAGPSGALNNIRFYAVDVTTLAVTFVGETSANTASGGNQSTSIAFGPDGNIYINGNSNFYKVNPANGSETLVNTTGGITFDDFATLPAPTPTINLKINKTANVTSVSPGNSIIYTINVTNQSPGCDVNGITVEDPDSTNASQNITVNGWSATLSGGGSVSPSSGTGNFSTTVNLPVGATATYTVNATTSSNPTSTTAKNSVRAILPDGINLPNGQTSLQSQNIIDIKITPQLYKSVKWLRDNDGTGTLTIGDDLQYTINIINPTSSVPINNVIVSDIVPTQLQVLRDGSNPITPPTGFTLASSLPTSSFNGTGTAVQFTNAATLPASTTVTLTYNARILPGASSPITNQALANYQGDGGVPARSDASDSNNPNAPGSGGSNTGNASAVNGNITQPNASANDPTIINFNSPVTPTGTKSAKLVQDNDSSGNVTTGDAIEYTITYSNTSSSAVTNFVVTDAIPNGLVFVPNSYSFTPTNTTVTGNSNYNGTNDINLTDPVNRGQLNPNTGKVVIKFRATVTNGSGAVISNQASALSSGGSVTPSLTDALSGPDDIPQGVDDGTNSGNLSPTGDDDSTLITVGSKTSSARLRLVKRITNITHNQATLSGINFNAFVDDPNDTNDNASGWSQISTVGITGLPSSNVLQSADQIEYTVYFLSDGAIPITNMKLCDPIPADTSYLTDSFGLGSGMFLNRAGTTSQLTNASDGDAGTFYSPLAPLPTGNVCSIPNNPNGSIILNLGTFSNTAGSNFGFIRFRVRVN